MTIKRAIVSAAFLAFIVHGALTQELIHSFKGDFSMAAADPMGNFYLVREDQLLKTDSLGNILFTYSNPVLGNIQWIDPSDPFRLLVYYRSFNQFITLDRSLSPIGDPVRLDDLELFSPLGICRSNQGGYWLIDGPSSSLVKLNSKLEKSVNSRVTGLMADNARWLPMIEWKERLYICIPEVRIFQFDLFGTSIKNIPAKSGSFGYSGLYLIFSGSQGYYIYKGTGLADGPVNPFNADLGELIISGNKALVNDVSGWHLYRLKKTF
jgi:hypothetical protein